MGVYDLAMVDTSPGQGGLFSPPEGWKGAGQAYLQLLRQRYQDPNYRQLFSCLVRISRSRTISFKGPFVPEAKRVLLKLQQSAESFKSKGNS